MFLNSKSIRKENDRLLDYLATYCSQKIADCKASISSLNDGDFHYDFEPYSYGYDKGALSELEFILSMIKTYYKFDD